MSIKTKLRLVEAGVLVVVVLGAAAWMTFGLDAAVTAPLTGLLAAVGAALSVVRLRLRQGAEAAAGLRRMGAG